MGKQKVNMQEEEELALEVKNFICLYDKRSPSYKDKRAKANAWAKIEKALGFEEGEHVFNFFEIWAVKWTYFPDWNPCMFTKVAEKGQSIPWSQTKRELAHIFSILYIQNLCRE